MATRADVQAFLAEFHQKLKVYDIRYRNDRGKNLQALLRLEITPAFRTVVIEALTVTDYVQGPRPDTLNGGSPLWVFGRLVKGKEIYIKISIGEPRRNVICISFHEAEYPLIYPFK